MRCLATYFWMYISSAELNSIIFSSYTNNTWDIKHSLRVGGPAITDLARITWSHDKSDQQFKGSKLTLNLSCNAKDCVTESSSKTKCAYLRVLGYCTLVWDLHSSQGSYTVYTCLKFHNSAAILDVNEAIFLIDTQSHYSIQISWWTL